MFILFLLAVAISLCDGRNSSETNYQICMVSSNGTSNKPALFHHGESPVWDCKSNSLYFVDVHKKNIHRLDYRSGRIYTKHINYGQVNVVSLVSHSHRLLVCARSAFYLLDWAVAGDDALRLLATVDQGMPDNVINEGKPDPRGRFWAGTKGPQTGDDVVPDKATLYSIEQGYLKPRVQLRPVTISNGLEWSLNGTVFYYVDSPTRKVEAFDCDLERGEISKRRTIIDITNYGHKDAIPDGMTIDDQGHLWVALMFGGTVLHIDPDSRQVVFSYDLPVARITSLAWGGPALDELYVMSSRVKAEPNAGAIFTIRNTGSKGLCPNEFKFDNADTY